MLFILESAFQPAFLRNAPRVSVPPRRPIDTRVCRWTVITTNVYAMNATDAPAREPPILTAQAISIRQRLNEIVTAVKYAVELARRESVYDGTPGRGGKGAIWGLKPGR